jgi:hypothetical protein
MRSHDDTHEPRHRLASFSLAVATLLPVVVVFPAAGIYLDTLMDEIPLSLALFLLPMIGVLSFFLMFLGAGAWLAVARFVVPRKVAERFFVVPGLGIFSHVSQWLFELAYGRGPDA